ncbi:MAG: Phosphoenolpyruvate synthase, partial [Candidatus Levybacteria bacterium GW2011_GWA2_36_13]
MSAARYVVWFSEVGKEDIPLVGGKAANLGEMYGADFPVPNGFVITSRAYYFFIKENNLNKKIEHLLNTANFERPETLVGLSADIKKAIIEAEMSKDLITEIRDHYKKLGDLFSDALVAVRSSATAEDLPNASFAGQQETFLNVSGDSVLLHKVKQCWASLFDARAIFYRHENKFDHLKIGIAVPVQKMIQSDNSGVMFTVDPLTNDKSKIIIEAIYGLGEMIVQGQVTPDHYEVDKNSLSIEAKKMSEQSTALVKKGKLNKEVNIQASKRSKQKISDSQIKELASIGKKLEKHYFFPQDIEWAIEKNKVYIVQTRPVTTFSQKKTARGEKEEIKLEVILKGEAASPGIVSGNVVILKSAKEINKVISGDILVAPQTNPDFVPAMKKAVAIVTDEGGRTSHAAIVSRELGIPAVVGTENATKILKNRMVITVDGAKGVVYKGGAYRLASTVNQVVEEHIKTATKVYVNLAEPELAKKVALENVDGVGLLRAEFMMAGIGIHPKKMIREGRKKEFIEKLSEQL